MTLKKITRLILLGLLLYSCSSSISFYKTTTVNCAPTYVPLLDENQKIADCVCPSSSTERLVKNNAGVCMRECVHDDDTTKEICQPN